MNDAVKTVVVALLSAIAGALLTLAIVNGPPSVTHEDAGSHELDELRARVAALERLGRIAPAAVAAAAAATAADVAEEESPDGPAPGERWSRTPVGNDRAERMSAQLREAGWTDAEINSLAELRDKAALELEHYRYEAMRRALQENPDELSPWRNRRSLMRETLGDEKYEQYLEAAGRPTAAEIRNVLAGSAGQAAGLQPGDRIRSYGSTRVYDEMDLAIAQMNGEPGEPVSVEIVRDGTVFYVTVPRGPLGVSRPARYGPEF